MSRAAVKTVNRWWIKTTLLCVLCACIFASRPLLPADLHDQEEVEAAFLYRFAGYVEWPPEAVSAPDFTIAVLGSDGIVQQLQRILPSHPLKNRPAQVRRITSLGELRDAQILFVGPQFNDQLRSLISRLASRPCWW
ncbi:MAG: YfiR family protein [Steroidobacteraceae bacterium]